MTRRLFALVAATAMIASLSISSASAAATPQSVLRASFQAYWSGGLGDSYATWGRGAQAWFHAANVGIDLEAGAARIGLLDGQVHCSGNVFGIWVLYADLTKAAVAGTSWEMSFGPLDGQLTPLAIQRTAVKSWVDPQGFWGGGALNWWQSVGVPVYGSLAPGDYTFHVVADNVDGHFEWNPTVHVVTC